MHRILIALVIFVQMASAEQPLNLIIIQTDEHNFRTLGCYRDTLSREQAFVWGEKAFVETPAIDSIAKRGVLCTSFYATSPVCTPSRAAFFTGVYPHNTGAPTNNEPLHDNMITFAEVLQNNGYATGYAGKWHLDGGGKPQWAPERKFGFADNRFMFNRGHWKKFEITDAGPRVAARQNNQPTYAVDGADETSFSTDWLMSRAIDFVKEHADQPFCYHLSLPDPHGPNTVRPPYNTMFDDMIIRAPLTFKQNNKTPNWAGGNTVKNFRVDLMMQYFGMVRCIDDNVARLLSTLDELNLTDHTAIVVTADHGDLCFEHGRLNKGNPYEGSAKVPMIIAMPSKLPAGRIVNEALGTVDFMPTVLSLMNYPAPKGMEGRDASKLLQGENVDWKDVAILRNAGTSARWMAAVTDRYKLVISTNDEPWLFDLKNDPDELVNAFGNPENHQITKFLAQELVAYGKAFHDPYLKEAALTKQLDELIQ